MDGRTIIYRTCLGVLTVAILGYTIFVLHDFIRGPRIIINNPETGFSTTTPSIMIIGKAIHVNNLAINSDATPFDLEGNFEGRLILAEGYNIIKVTAKDRYERTIEKDIEINLLSSPGKIELLTNIATTTEGITATSTTNN